MMLSIKEFYLSMELAAIPKCDTHDLGDFEKINNYADYSESPHMEEWRKKLLKLSLLNYFANVETFKDSWNDEAEQLLQEALKTPYFTQFSPAQQQHP
ncbi:hypothetical protein PTKIN_Ptkin05aG0175800 [Pterospermum kingtungense]